MINTNNLITAKAVVKRIRMSPVKVRRVLKLVKNCSYQDALILLEFLPYKACGPVWQVLRSAVANAEYKYQFDKKDLRIKEIYVNQGPGSFAGIRNSLAVVKAIYIAKKIDYTIF